MIQSLSCRLLTAVLSVTFSAGVIAQTCLTEAQYPDAWKDGRYIDRGNGMIFDRKTGLIWQRCPVGQSGNSCETGSAKSHNWQQALEAARDSRAGNRSDWQLPDIKQLATLSAHNCFSPAINTTIFPTPAAKNKSDGFWSSSPVASDPEKSWGIASLSGISVQYRREDSQWVRLVRIDDTQ